MPYNKDTAKERWTIEKMKDYRKFCGWDTLREIVDAVDIDLKGPSGEILIHNDLERDEGRAMVATVFETGSRICETIGQGEDTGFDGMLCSDFNIGFDRVITTFKIEKRYTKLRRVTKYKAVDGCKLRWISEAEAIKSGHEYEPYSGYLTERETALRNIVIPLNEPLANIMVNWVKELKHKKDSSDKIFDIKYNRAYRIITNAAKVVGVEDFPPHRLRAERATQLVLEYGLDDHELTDWFAWKNPKEAHDYTTLAPRIVEKMFMKR